MKFPYKLSKERLSLLSKEDRAIYEYEHSSYAQLEREMLKSNNSNRLIDLEQSSYKDNDDLVQTDEEFSEEELDDFYEAFNEVLFEQLDELLENDLKELYPEEDYQEMRATILEVANKAFKESDSLNEAEGHSSDWWLDCSWIVKIAGASLAGLAGIIASLIMAGKDKLAMEKLKRYMNRLVELTDQGVNKKKPWYSFLMPSKIKNNMGEQNKMCFRNIYETAERNIACATIDACVTSGMINPEHVLQITTGEGPQEGSGLDLFKKNIIDKIDIQKK